MNVETIVKECVNEMLPILDNKRWKGNRTEPLLNDNHFNVVLESVALKLGVKLEQGTIFKVFHDQRYRYSSTKINGVNYYPIKVRWGYQTNISYTRSKNRKLNSDTIHLTYGEYFTLFREHGWKEIEKTNAPHIGKTLLDCIERVFTLIVQKYYNFMLFTKWKKLPVGTKLIVRSWKAINYDVNDEYEIDVNPNSLKIAELKSINSAHCFKAWVDFSDTTDCKKSYGTTIPWECVVGIQKGSV